MKVLFPFIVPPEKVEFDVPLTVKVNVLVLRVPADIITASTDAFTSRVQVPVPFASKYTISENPGTDAPLAPPDVVDQLAVLFQLDAEVAIQYRSAARVNNDSIVSNTVKLSRNIFISCIND